MKTPLIAIGAAIALACGSPLHAHVYLIDLSPPAGDALNLGTNVYPGDGAAGLSPLNEPSLPNSGTATGSGGEIGAGITYDNHLRELTLNAGFGEAFGFTDLGSDLNVGAAGGIHIHGAADPGSNASIVFNLTNLGLFTPSGNRAGSVQNGVITLDAAQEEVLMNNQYYLNIHSLDNGSGEIRGQLVITGIIPEPSSLVMSLLGIVGVATSSRRR